MYQNHKNNLADYYVDESPCASKRSAFVGTYRFPSLRSPQLLYDAYKFRRTFCITSDDGSVEKIPCNDVETILIPKNWFKRARKNLGPGEGYLGKGMSKWAFQVHASSPIVL